MKPIKLQIFTLLSVLVLTACNEGSPSLSIEECYQMNMQEKTLMTGWYHLTDSANGFARQVEGMNDPTVYYIAPHPIVTAEDIVRTEVTTNNEGLSMLAMYFGERGKPAWSEATKTARNKHLAFVADDKLISTPHVNIQITKGVSAIGRADYTDKDLQQLEEQITAGKEALKKR